MAEIDFYDDGYGYDDGARRAAPQGAGPAAGGGVTGVSSLGAVLNWAGAFVSLGLVVGMGVWAWQLAVRDVSEVPVVRALEGPMRIAPDDPGGTQAPNQGLAVNRIAEGAEAEPVPDQLVLAPPPMDLQDLGVAPPAEDATDETLALIDRVLSLGTRLEPAEAPAAAPLEDGVDVTFDVAAPETPAAPPVDTGASALRIIPASVPGVAVSLRPVLRPAAIAQAATRVATSGSASTAEGVAVTRDALGVSPGDGVQEVAVTDLVAGTRLVQLGAFDSAEIARREWGRLASQFPDFLQGRPRVIEQASSGGQTFFRLRAAGFDDLNASRRFCAALVSRGAACIPVTVR